MQDEKKGRKGNNKRLPARCFSVGGRVLKLFLPHEIALFGL